MTPPSPTGGGIVPCLRYRDAAQAIDWLCANFGFERHAVHTDEAGGVVHAELRLGRGLVMIGPVGPEPTDWGRHIRQPDETGGAETQAAYIVVADPDAVHARASAAGARMLIDIRDEPYGGRGFTCADPEGHIWSVGNYDPWAQTT